MFQRKTGISRRNVATLQLEELWRGDVIKCKVYAADPHGHLPVEGEVIWDEENGRWSIDGEYTINGRQYKTPFPLCTIVLDGIVFVKKVPRQSVGDAEDAVWEILSMLRSYAQEPSQPEFGPDEFPIAPEHAVEKATVEMVIAIVSEIEGFGIIDKEKIRTYMESTR